MLFYELIESQAHKAQASPQKVKTKSEKKEELPLGDKKHLKDSVDHMAVDKSSLCRLTRQMVESVTKVANAASNTTGTVYSAGGIPIPYLTIEDVRRLIGSAGSSKELNSFVRPSISYYIKACY